MERLGMTFDKIIYTPGLVEGLEGMRDEAPFALYRVDRDERGPARVLEPQP
jgi:hypothetical protein